MAVSAGFIITAIFGNLESVRTAPEPLGVVLELMPSTQVQERNRSESSRTAATLAVQFTMVRFT